MVDYYILLELKGQVPEREIGMDEFKSIEKFKQQLKNYISKTLDCKCFVKECKIKCKEYNP